MNSNNPYQPPRSGSPRRPDQRGPWFYVLLVLAILIGVPLLLAACAIAVVVICLGVAGGPW